MKQNFRYSYRKTIENFHNKGPIESEIKKFFQEFKSSTILKYDQDFYNGFKTAIDDLFGIKNLSPIFQYWLTQVQ